MNHVNEVMRAAKALKKHTFQEGDVLHALRPHLDRVQVREGLRAAVALGRLRKHLGLYSLPAHSPR